MIEAGVVHAIGAGLVIAEIQQASDTTFRLYDWNRVRADGQPRSLQVQEALAAIDFEAAPVVRQEPLSGDRVERVERLLECDKFVLDRCGFQGQQEIGGDEKFHLVVVLHGQVLVDSDPAQLPLQRGQACLVPAEIGPVQLAAVEPVTLLDIYLP